MNDLEENICKEQHTNRILVRENATRKSYDGLSFGLIKDNPTTYVFARILNRMVQRGSLWAKIERQKNGSWAIFIKNYHDVIFEPSCREACKRVRREYYENTICLDENE